ncbi:MAG: hypothetical protein PHO74_00575 [Weeksellaceae bacterium]|jgi:hypothetical protein|nr:hypothetical protein [Weeksellaceae bacterium]
MKKTFSIVLLGLLFMTGIQFSNAQTYNNAIGLGIDLGDGATLVGPQYKHFFNSDNAVNAQVLFGNHMTTIGVDYSYNQKFAGSGLGWYVGVGPQLSFIDGPGDSTYFAIRPAVGLEYKIPTVPLGFHFDWKPWWNLTNDSNIEAGRFSLGFKYILN